MVKRKSKKQIPPEKLPEILKLIEQLVHEEKTDREIAQILHLPVSKVYTLRLHKLKIVLCNKKRECLNCKKPKYAACFSSKHPGYEDWCIECRRKIGLDVYHRKKRTEKPKLEQQKEICRFICIRCNKVFESLTWGINNRQHFYACERCRSIINMIDRVGI